MNYSKILEEMCKEFLLEVLKHKPRNITMPSVNLSNFDCAVAELNKYYYGESKKLIDTIVVHSARAMTDK
jgi:hypothetical protein